MRLLVCGSRSWTDTGEIAYHLALIFGTERERIVIHGNSGNLKAKPPRGVDVIAGWCAGGVGATVVACPADWKRYGRKRAGVIRNAAMLRDHQPDRGLAFGALWRFELIEDRSWGVGGRWKRTGTGDMVKRLLAARLPVRWIAAPGAEAVDLTAMPPPEEDPQIPLRGC